MKIKVAITQMNPGTLASSPNWPPVSQIGAPQKTGFNIPTCSVPLTPKPSTPPCTQFAIQCSPRGRARLLVRRKATPNRIDARNIFILATSLVLPILPGLLTYVRRKKMAMINWAGHTPKRAFLRWSGKMGE
jgi:hypothetical protein